MIPGLNLRRLVMGAAAFACGAALAQSNPSPDPETATTSLDVQLSATTDVRNRGVSDSLRRPGAKVSLQAAHESGVIGLLELATVSKKQFLDGDGASVLAGLGYRLGDPDGWHFGMGLAGEWFPGAGFDAPHGLDLETFQPIEVRRSRYDSQFLLLEAGYGPLEARLIHVFSRSYRGADTGGVCGQLLQVSADPAAGLACFARGDHGSRGTRLLDLNYQVRLTAQSTLNLHAGRQQVKNFREADTTDFAVGPGAPPVGLHLHGRVAEGQCPHARDLPRARRQPPARHRQQPARGHGVAQVLRPLAAFGRRLR